MARPTDHAGMPAALRTTGYARIAKRIGLKLRDVYEAPEGEPLPAEHVDLLLRLRHKERDQARLGGA